MANALRSCEESDSSQVFISAHQLAKIVAGFYEFHAQSPFMRESIEFLKGRGVIANKDAKFIEDSFIVMGKGTKQLCFFSAKVGFSETFPSKLCLLATM